MVDTIDVLGTTYKIMNQSAEENQKLEQANGLCEVYAKKIIISSDIKDNKNTYENLEAFKNKVIRHEIVHAFFAESGLRGCSEYAENEELIDWIAIQFPKLAYAFVRLNCLD